MSVVHSGACSPGGYAGVGARAGAMIRRMANCVVVSAAIRFDKLAVRYLATVRIATLAEWLR